MTRRILVDGSFVFVVAGKPERGDTPSFGFAPDKLARLDDRGEYDAERRVGVAPPANLWRVSSDSACGLQMTGRR